MIGTPVVASYVGGTPDMVSHGEDGFLYQCDAPYMAAYYISQLFDDQGLCERISAAAVKRAGSRQDKEKTAGKLPEIYDKVVSMSDKLSCFGDGDTNPFITVVMPSLNVAPYIERCLESVVDQTLRNIEIICVDAGSDDGTVEIISKYAEKDRRIRLIHSDIKSYGYQVNLAIKESKGDYIGIVETDDFIEADMYKELYSIAQMVHINVIKSNYRIFKEFSYNCYAQEWTCLHNIDLYDRLINNEELNSLVFYDYNVWNGIYKRDFLISNDIKCTETLGASFQDIGFIQRVHNAVKDYYYCSKALYIDREEASSYSKKSLNNMCFEYKELFNDTCIKRNIRDLLMVKFADSFLGEYRKVLKIEGYNNDSVYLSDSYLWASELINKEGVYNIIDSGLFNQETRLELLLLLSDRDSFASFRKFADEEIEGEKTLLRKIAGDNSIVICGFGNWGKMLLFKLFDIGTDVVAFADNAQDKWRDAQVFYPEITGIDSAVKKFPDALFMIANKNHADEIEQQLLSLGIRKEIIHVWKP